MFPLDTSGATCSDLYLESAPSPGICAVLGIAVHGVPRRMSRVYESGQFFQKVKESVNGLEREYLEEKKWRRGDPFDDQITNRGLSSPQFRDGSRLPPPSTHRIVERTTVEDRDFDQPSSRTSNYRHEPPMDGRSSRHQIVPPTPYKDGHQPVYSIINSKPSDYSSRSDSQNERTILQTESKGSRPGSPQVVAGPGDIINTEHGFTIELDVKHFRPQDIKVTLKGNTLSVVGDRLEDDSTSTQTLRRSFTRKYAMPHDVHLSSISSYMTDSGILILSGSRKGWKETEISVHLAPSQHHHSTSAVISIV